MTTCTSTKADGSPCRAQALPGKAVCVFHDPDGAERRAEARRRGGHTRNRPPATLPADAPDMALATVADIVGAVASVFNQVRKGILDAKVGNCLSGLLGVQLRALAGEALEQRVAALERAAEARKLP